MLAVADISLGSFEMTASRGGEAMCLSLSGTGDMAAVAPLRKCLDEVRSEVVRLGLNSVSVDITSLYLLNSSCIKAFVRFVYQIQSEGPAFPVVFTVDRNLTWQARALAALERMAPEVVSVK